MYTLSQIRRRVDALKRKYASDLTVIRLRPLAEEYCLLWSEALADGNAPPDSYAFIRHIARQGFRFDNFTSLHLYLERCRDGERLPNSIGIVASLLPQVPPARLEELLHRDSSDAPQPAPSFSRWVPSWLRNPHAVTLLLGGLPDLPDSAPVPVLSKRRKPVSSGPRAHESWLPGGRPLCGTAAMQRGQLPFAHCHPRPAGAKLPPIPHTRNAIRQPLRC